MTTATASRRKASDPKASMSAGALKAALKAVDPAVPSRPARPILSNVLLGKRRLAATTLDLRITVSIDYAGPPTLLPFDRLKAIATSLPDTAEVSLDIAATAVTVYGATGKWRLPVEDFLEFPDEATSKPLPVARLPSDQFCRAVDSSIIGIDAESSRYALGAVLLHVMGEEINFVGTDGRRLCIVEAGVEQAVDDSTTLCPPDALKAAAKLAEHHPGAVQIEKTSSVVVLSSERWRVVGRMIEGTFPRWPDVIPEREVNQTVVDRAELLAAVQAAGICTSEVSRGVMFRLGKTLKLSARSSEAGEAAVECPVVEAGDEVTVQLDPRYVVEWLESLPGKDADPNVTIDAADKSSAVVFRCDDATNVVMPLESDA